MLVIWLVVRVCSGLRIDFGAVCVFDVLGVVFGFRVVEGVALGISTV